MSAEALYAQFPWLAQLGLESEVRRWLTEGLEGEALVGALRRTPQYQQRFPWIKRQDGTLRMNEADYMRNEDQYRVLFRQYGFDEPTNPMEYGSFFQGEVSPNELKERFETYRGVQRAGREVKEAFYVYAGMKLTDDDLYQAVVEPARAEALKSEYNQRVAASPLDYATWVQRTTEVGLQRVTDTLAQLEREGIVTGTAIERIRQVNPDFAKQMMDTLYTGGDPGAANFMSSTDELLATFEEAMIGGAAAKAGLGLPSKERVAELRAAGVQRAQALKSYSDYAMRQNLVAGAVQRATAQQFGREEFEGQEFLGDARAKELMDTSMKQEEALGKGGGGVEASRDRTGQIAQQGFRSARF